MTDTKELADALEEQALKEKLAALREERSAARDKKDAHLGGLRHCVECDTDIERGEVRAVLFEGEGARHARCPEHETCYTECVEQHELPPFVVPGVVPFFENRRKDSGLSPRQTISFAWSDYMGTVLSTPSEKVTIARKDLV